jgi:carbamoyl-phosphate synthase small subunit
VLVGNGPGDPAQLVDAIRTVRDMLAVGRVHVFGVCLGHQLLGLALGMQTYKLPFGHRGANHPVRVRRTSRVLVTVQNHGFAVEAGDAAEVSHVSLNDGTTEGLEGDGFSSLQFHPEAAPGPLDALPFFDRIAETCRSARTYAAS